MGQGLLTPSTGYWLELFQGQHFLISTTEHIMSLIPNEIVSDLASVISFADLNSPTRNAWNFFPLSHVKCSFYTSESKDLFVARIKVL